MEIPLNGGNAQFSLKDLLDALKNTEDGERPVENWNPAHCGEMDMVIRVETDPDTLEPSPFITVRGRLEASLARSVFYEIVDLAVTRETKNGDVLGVWASGEFFPLGPAGILEGHS